VAFLASSRTLLVADAHIGKAVSFARSASRCRGTRRNARALSALVAAGAHRIVFLGDFPFRTAHAGDPRRGRALAVRAPVARLVLVRGNPTAAPATAAVPRHARRHESHSRSTASRFATTRGRCRLRSRRPPASVLSLGARLRPTCLPCFWLGDESACCAFGLHGMHRSAPARPTASFDRRRRGRRAAGARFVDGRPLRGLKARAMAFDPLHRPPDNAPAIARLEAVLHRSRPRTGTRRRFRYARAAAGRSSRRHVARDPPPPRWSRSMRKRLLRNTEQFVAGKGANNVL
jgi:hypothetical protein